MSDYRILDRCLCCDSTDIEILLDLNNQPLANSYHKEDEVLDEYPLGVNICNNCYHIQLTHVVNPDLLFKDYLYVSGTTKTLHDNMKWFVDYVLRLQYGVRVIPYWILLVMTEHNWITLKRGI